MGFVDLHSHVLPSLDDGAPDSRISLEMLKGLADLGFDTVCATPHQKTGQFLPSLAAIRAAHAATSAALRAAGMSLHLSLGAENMWDSTLYARMEADEIPSYDGGPAFLVEFTPSQLPTSLSERIFELRRRGRLPVIAHPERYVPLWKDRRLLDLLRADCAMVVDLGAVAGLHGRREGKAARRFLEEGLVHAVASDLHSPADLRGAAQGMAWIRKRLGERALVRLLDRNPRRILAGHHPE